MAPGITNDPRGVQDTPRSGIAAIDRQVAKLQREDAARLAAAERQVGGSEVTWAHLAPEMAETFEQQFAREERELARMLKSEPSGPAETVNAATRALRSTASRVSELRAKTFSTEASRASDRMVAAREARQAEQAKQAERKAREPGRKACRNLVTFADPELRGRMLSSSRLSTAEGVELLALVEDRIAGTLGTRQRKRYEQLVGIAAGDPGLFEAARKEREAAEAVAAEAERARLDAMPLRSYTGRGGAYLPAFVCSWLTDSRAGTLTVTDVGVLAAILLAIENGEPLFVGSAIEAGAIVLDAAHGFQLRAGIGDDCTGASRVRDSVRYLADNDWLAVSAEGGRTRIELGPRARKLIEEATAPAVT